MSEVPEELVVLRGAIDNMDAALIHLLAERFRITREVGRLKAVTLRATLPEQHPHGRQGRGSSRRLHSRGRRARSRIRLAIPVHRLARRLRPLTSSGRGDRKSVV